MPKKFNRHQEVPTLEGEIEALWTAIDGLLKREQRVRDETPGIAGGPAGGRPTTTTPRSRAWCLAMMGA
ncbi:MAG: hypothetical protein ACYTAN_09795 [Planctomycetota bacterium]|jgi:hypothetical protein